MKVYIGEVFLSRLGLRTKLFLVMGLVVAACIAALSWAAYTTFNQPLAAMGYLIAVIVVLVVVRIAFISKVMPSKQRAGEQANF